MVPGRARLGRLDGWVGRIGLTYDLKSREDLHMDASADGSWSGVGGVAEGEDKETAVISRVCLPSIMYQSMVAAFV